MSTENHSPAADVLEQAISSLRNVALDKSPPAELQAPTVALLQSRQGLNPPKTALPPRQQPKRWNSRISALAAALVFAAVVLGATTWWTHQGPSAFAQMVANVKQATSVVFTNTISSEPKPGISISSKSKNLLQGNFVRSDDLGTTKNGVLQPGSDSLSIIIDTQTKQDLRLDSKSKTAQIETLHELSANFLNDPVRTFSGLAETDAVLLGEEQLNGKRTLLYQLKKLDIGAGFQLKEGETAKVWVDPETHLPMQLLLETWIENPNLKPFLNRQLMSDFHWNEELDANLFSMSLPDGYQFAKQQADDNVHDFMRAVTNAKQASSVSCTLKSGVSTMPKMEMKYYLQGKFLRMEVPGKQETFDAKVPFTTIAVFDLDGKKTTSIDFISKTFQSQQDSFDQNLAAQQPNPVEYLSTVTERDAEQIGDEQLNGRNAHVYRLLKIRVGDKNHTLDEGESVKVWVDVESELPAKIESELLVPMGDSQMKSLILIENFEWNKPIAPDLFKLEVPEGFKVVEGPAPTPKQAK